MRKGRFVAFSDAGGSAARGGRASKRASGIRVFGRSDLSQQTVLFRASDRGSAMRRASSPGSSLVRLAALSAETTSGDSQFRRRQGDHRVGREQRADGMRGARRRFGAQQRKSEEVRRQRLAAMDIGGGGGFAPSTTGLTCGWIDGPPPPEGRRKIAPADWGAEASRSQVSTKLNVWCLAFCLFAVETGAGAGRCWWQCPPNRLHVLRLAVPSSRGSSIWQHALIRKLATVVLEVKIVTLTDRWQFMAV